MFRATAGRPWKLIKILNAFMVARYDELMIRRSAPECHTPLASMLTSLIKHNLRAPGAVRYTEQDSSCLGNLQSKTDSLITPRDQIPTCATWILQREGQDKCLDSQIEPSQTAWIVLKCTVLPLSNSRLQLGYKLKL